ncbi:MAG TPA: winged helix DNA-binding domain-containing protein [Candidatus Limnocylindria bacterium]|nr:winged helix DNA-binding domain-containing protein [Candidatus Limnocylindria bacterium]
MRARPGPPPTLTLRELNRALLARQLLLSRERIGLVTAIERLGGLQAQWAPAPYIGLWSRLERFRIADLERAITARRVVKATLMRGTLHLVSARDYAPLAVVAPEARRRLWATTERALKRYFATLSPAARRVVAEGRGIDDPDALHRALLRYARTPRTREEIATFMATETGLPGELAERIVWNFIASFGRLVQPAPAGHWSQRESGRLVSASTWLGITAWPPLETAARHLVRRHLGAFGPATVDDIASWGHVRTPLIREAIAALGASVREFRDERGRTLFDLADAPRPPADTPAAVRFLPKWDSTLLAYSPPERVRILEERHRRTVIIKNGDVAQTILVDGMVRGTWSVTNGREAVLTIRPFGRLTRADRGALGAEGEALVRFVSPGARAHAVRFE